MRLIHTNKLELHQFFDSEVPKYAILSHTWGENEVPLQDFTDISKRHGLGWEKIMQCCRLAQAEGLTWAWVDTCCIDKTSSADLSEAINAMFKYYSDAAVCYAFLSDLAGQADTSDVSSGSTGLDLSTCRWFTRGWTLQELLAPQTVLFFDQQFLRIGTKSSLIDQISVATNIPTKYLLGRENIQEACVAQRMSWASRRQTTRQEDIAYCLLGIFDINMPLLYGEGRKAFIRLQEQIITQSDDESIFAWVSSMDTGTRGMLAEDPSEFAEGRHMRRGDLWFKRPPCTFSNRGFELSMVWLGNDILTRELDNRPVNIKLDCTYYRKDGEAEYDRRSRLSHGEGPKEVCIRLRPTFRRGVRIWYRSDESRLRLSRHRIFGYVVGILGFGYTTICVARSSSTHVQSRDFKRESAKHDEHRAFLMAFTGTLRNFLLFLGMVMVLLMLNAREGHPSLWGVVGSWASLSIGWKLCQMDLVAQLCIFSTAASALWLDSGTYFGFALEYVPLISIAYTSGWIFMAKQLLHL